VSREERLAQHKWCVGRENERERREREGEREGEKEEEETGRGRGGWLKNPLTLL
jgi:hypothetical protein